MSKLTTCVSEVGEEIVYGKIFMSNVVVTRKRNLFMDRTWSTIDVIMAIGLLSTHLLTLFAPFTFSWGTFWAAFWGYVLSGMLGITISYHRNLSHRSFKLPKWLEYTFAYIGIHSVQGHPISWVSLHRNHHKYVDTEKDTHSPTFGFWFSHMGWIFNSGDTSDKHKEYDNVEDLKSQVFYRFLERTYVFHVLGFAAIVYAIGGFPYLVWVMGVRLTCNYQFTFLVNSVCHIWGSRTWNTNDLSTNNLWVALLTFGEGWHNNHHAFQYSARMGLEWWQIDFSWYFIRFLEILGLATNVKVPKEAHKVKKSFAPPTNKVM